MDRPAVSLGPSFIPLFFSHRARFPSVTSYQEVPSRKCPTGPCNGTSQLSQHLFSDSLPSFPASRVHPMILFSTRSYKTLCSKPEASFPRALRPPRPDGLPVSGVMPRTTALQILSCGCYEHYQRTRSRSKEWMQAHRLQSSRVSGSWRSTAPRPDDPGGREANVSS
jgi:hypothetical protein